MLPSSTGSISSIDDIDPDRIDKLLVVWSVTYVTIGHIVHDEILFNVDRYEQELVLGLISQGKHEKTSGLKFSFSSPFHEG